MKTLTLLPSAWAWPLLVPRRVARPRDRKSSGRGVGAQSDLNDQLNVATHEIVEAIGENGGAPKELCDGWSEYGGGASPWEINTHIDRSQVGFDHSGRHRNLILALLITFAISCTAWAWAAPQRPAPPTGRAPDFSGIWVEIPRPPGKVASAGKGYPPIRLTISQHGSQLEVRGFGPVATATIQSNGTATWTVTWTSAGCAVSLRKPGYDYDHLGAAQFILGLEHPIDGGAPVRPQMSFTEIDTWNAPCDGHPIGTEQMTSILRRADQ